jgi:transposase
VVLKPLTDAERMHAREKATAARTVRADVKARLKSGELTVDQVIGNGDGDEALGRLKVLDLLKALPGVGEVRAAAIMKDVGIAPTRRVRGLGIHQRRALVEHLEEHSGAASK